MMMKWLRRQLKTDQIYDEVLELRQEYGELNAEIVSLRSKLATVASGLGRVIAKLDPIYGVDELDPKRKAESDRLGKQVLDRLAGENKAIRHTEGKLP